MATDAFALAPHLREAALDNEDYAALREDPAFVALVSERRHEEGNAGGDVEASGALGTWLVDASIHGDVESAVDALDAGASLEFRSSKMGRTALNAAAKGARAEVVQLLVGRGADICARDAQGNSPLSGLVQRGPDPELARYMLDHGAEVDAENDDGWTALSFAARWDTRWNAVTALLLARGADPNHRMRVSSAPSPAPKASVLAVNLSSEIRVGPKFDGYTALLRAAKMNRAAVVERLCAAGADPTARSTNGETALSLAKGKKLRAFLASRA